MLSAFDASALSQLLIEQADSMFMLERHELVAVGIVGPLTSNAMRPQFHYL